MKKVEAIIRPSKLKAIQKALKAVDIPCITVIPVSGSGLQKSYTKIYRGTEQSLALQNRTMIICVVSDKNLEKCVDSILEHGSDGQVGDGKIFIYDVQDAIRLSTKVRGDKAIIYIIIIFLAYFSWSELSCGGSIVNDISLPLILKIIFLKIVF